MMQLSSRFDSLQPSGIRRFTALAQTVEDCVMLTLGEPDFPTPAPIKAALSAALDSDRTHYAPNRGTDALRATIAQYETCRGFPLEADQVIVTAGATGALYNALLGILDPGDECIIPTPAFPLYESIVRIAGGVPVFLDTRPYGCQVDESALQSLVTDKTKAIILNSPNNPTGCVYTQSALDGVKRAALARDLWLVCDNVYSSLCDSACPDLCLDPQLSDRTLLCQSFSKPYAMTGWRIGYLAGPRQVMDKMVLLQAAQMASVPTFIQDACLAALSYDPSAMAESYRQRREYVCRRLRTMGLPFHAPQGAFYVFPNIASYGLDSETFATRLIREAKVAVVPGACFRGEGHIRISCCCSPEALETGMDRLEAFLQTL